MVLSPAGEQMDDYGEMEAIQRYVFSLITSYDYDHNFDVDLDLQAMPAC